MASGVEKDKVIKRLSLSVNATAELKKTHKLEREAMEKKHKEDIAKAENEHEKEIKAMEKRQLREINTLNTKVSKKDQKLAKLREKKKGQAS